MTNNEAAKWIQLYIDLANIDPTTGEEAYLNEDARKTLEAMGMAVDALIGKQAAADRIIDGLPSAQPEYRLDEWCADCKEYDTERHCCPRFNQVIRTTLDEMKSERKKGKWEIYVISMFDGEDCRCSECGKTGCVPYWNYCPNCGARMTEEKC